MAAIITCPNCRSSLRVPEGETAEQLSCPRCQAPLDNPNIDPPERSKPRRSPSRRQPVEDERDSCPSCNEWVDLHWRTCPNCGEPLDEPDIARERVPDVSLQEGGALSLVGLIMVMVGLLAGSILFLYFRGDTEDYSFTSTKEQAQFVSVWLVVCIGVVVAGMIMTAAGRDRTRRIVGIVLGVVTLLALSGFLFIAGLVYTVSSCLEGCFQSKPTTSQQAPRQRNDGAGYR